MGGDLHILMMHILLEMCQRVFIPFTWITACNDFTGHLHIWLVCSIPLYLNDKRNSYQLKGQ